MIASDLYSKILDEYFVIGCARLEENELGAAAFCANSLLAPLPNEPLRAERISAIADRFSEVSKQQRRALFRTASRPFLQQLDACTPRAYRLLHEGFLVNPVAEEGATIDSYRRRLSDRMLASDPRTWRAGGEKSDFRVLCKSLLGRSAVPPGVELSVSSYSELVEQVRKFAATRNRPIVVKFPGVGGSGNVRIARCDDPRVKELWDVHVDTHAEGVDVVVEEWIPWTDSYCLSFFIDEGGRPDFLALRRQVIDQRRSKFVGGSTQTGLSERSAKLLTHWVEPVVQALSHGGLRGILAFDVVVNRRESATRNSEEMNMTLIECNPRVNRHNRVDLMATRIAKTWGTQLSTLRWSLTDRVATRLASRDALARSIDNLFIPPRLGEVRHVELADSSRVMDLRISRTS